MERKEEYQRCFWARRPDRIVVDQEKETCYVLEFRSNTDRGTAPVLAIRLSAFLLSFGCSPTEASPTCVAMQGAAR